MCAPWPKITKICITHVQTFNLKSYVTTFSSPLFTYVHTNCFNRCGSSSKLVTLPNTSVHSTLKCNITRKTLRCEKEVILEAKWLGLTSHSNAQQTLHSVHHEQWRHNRAGLHSGWKFWILPRLLGVKSGNRGSQVIGCRDGWQQCLSLAINCRMSLGDAGLLEYDTVSLGEWFPTFQTHGVSSHHHELPIQEGNVTSQSTWSTSSSLTHVKLHYYKFPMFYHPLSHSPPPTA